MTNNIHVYIASPYTLGDVGINIKHHMDCASKLIDKGFVPFVPLLYHYLHILHPKSYNEWFQQDLRWLSKCDCLLRLPGESRGADMEVEFAQESGIAVFYSIDEMMAYYADL